MEWKRVREWCSSFSLGIFGFLGRLCHLFPRLRALLLVPATVAPPSWIQPRDSFLESWEAGIRVPPAVCARKKESALLNSRIFMKKQNLEMAESGVRLEMLGHRRNTRLSSTVPPLSSSMGGGKGSRLSSVAESDGLEGDFTKVHGDATPSMAADALLVAQGSDVFLKEEGGQVGNSASSMVPTLGNSSMGFQSSIDAALLLGDAQVSHDCSPLVSESLEVVYSVMADLVVVDSAKEAIELGLGILHTVPGGCDALVHQQDIGMVVGGPLEEG
ncbi:hypothetical protein Dimus_035612 [Dionaea muscipula]